MTPDTPTLADDAWSIVQPEMDWLRLPFWESIFSLSNGLLGVRGSFEEPMTGTRSRPMGFMAGLYNTLPKRLPELPLLPDWLTTKISLGGTAFDLRFGHIRRFTRWLDLGRGLLTRDLLWEDPQGRTTHLSFERFLSLHDRELAVLRVRITPIDWSGPVQVEGGLAMPPVPAGPGRESFRSHWRPARPRTQADGICSLSTRTRQTNRPLAAAAAFRVAAGDQALQAQAYQGHLEPHRPLTFDRFVIFRSDAPGVAASTVTANKAAKSARLEGFDALLADHVAVCRDMWERIDIELDGPVDDQRAIRFNLFQLATLCPRAGDIASIGPKGLCGTHYLGHIFWDTEIYMLPFFALTHPEGARTLLDYRVHTLDGARRKAASNGYRGAQYAWESADTGDEACPRYLPDPVTGQPIRIWCGDLEDHITADVPFAIDYYVNATGDKDYLWNPGAEIYFETARFWASRVTKNAQGKYDILDAMGPDEFHIHVDNDAITNYMAHWNLNAAADLYDSADFPAQQRNALIAKLELGPEEPQQWRQIADNLVLLEDPETGFIQEHTGFTDRPDLSPDIFRIKRRVPITDLIGANLAVEGQVLKQAEVVVVQCLLEDRFTRASREINFDYYEPRTSHDSSLSVSAHAWSAARLERIDLAYDFFRRALYLDLDDLAGNTSDGLHTANMGGVWLALVFGFVGLNIKGDTPVAEPRLPAAWRRVRFKIIHRGTRYLVDCTSGQASIEPA